MRRGSRGEGRRQCGGVCLFPPANEAPPEAPCGAGRALGGPRDAEAGQGKGSDSGGGARAGADLGPGGFASVGGRGPVHRPESGFSWSSHGSDSHTLPAVTAMTRRPARPRRRGGGDDKLDRGRRGGDRSPVRRGDRKSTRLNSSHLVISYAVFCLKKKKKKRTNPA